jgi:acyl-CoA reductase-like NAD-dependent aldehyde dehydrogenase
VGNDAGLLVDGVLVGANADLALNNSASRKPFAAVPRASAEDAGATVAGTKRVQRPWEGQPTVERRDNLERFGDFLRNTAAAFAQTLHVSGQDIAVQNGPKEENHFKLRLLKVF